MNPPNPNGVVTGRNLGPEFTVNETHGKINIQLGPGLYRAADGRICLQPRWVASRWDRFLAALAIVVAFAAGWLAAATIDSTGDWVVFAAVAGFAAAGGWVAHRFQPDW